MDSKVWEALVQWHAKVHPYISGGEVSEETKKQVLRFHQDWRGLDVDGIVGPKTLASLGLSQPQPRTDSGLVKKISKALLAIGERTRSANFSRNGKDILDACTALGVTDKGQVAYVLATASHESLFAPIKEYRGLPGTYAYAAQKRYWHTGYYGRGYVQLTWKANYARMGALLGIDLVNNPELALDSKIAAKVMVLGMRDGLFTGVGLARYIKGGNRDYVNARRIVNGTDKAAKIAEYAKWYAKLL